MDPTTISILIAVLGCVVAVITFVAGRQSGAKSDGERWGKLDANFQHVQDDLREIKTTLAVTQKATDEELKRMRKDTKDGISYVHDRLDDHLRSEHGMTVPKRSKS